jgi:hypothetical protein
MHAKPNILLFDEALRVTSPISTVFAFVANHENYVHWYPGAVAVSSSDALPPGTVGKVYRETLRLPSGRDRSFDIKVVESQIPDRFVTEGALAPLYPRMEMRLTESAPNETTLNLKFYSRSQSAVGRWLIRNLVRRVMQRQARAALVKLGTLLD